MGVLRSPAQVTADAKRVEIDAHELAILLEGLEVVSKRHAKRWNPPVALGAVLKAS